LWPLPPPSSYEQIGKIAHFNLKQDIYKNFHHQQLIGQVLLETSNGTIDVVVQKVGQVSGKYRTYDYQVLASSPSSQITTETTTTTTTKNKKKKKKAKKKNDSNEHDDYDTSLMETTVVEDGVTVHLNVAECYWCTRLSGERQEVLNEILYSTNNDKSLQQDLVVADVFCGVGAICLLLAKKRQQLLQQQQNSTTIATTSTTISPPTTKIIANDWNPKAIEYFHSSIRANHLDANQFQLSCQEAYDFLMDLGCNDNERDNENDSSSSSSSLSTTAKMPLELPDHVLMNFPLEAPKFLGALRWWSWEQVQAKKDASSTYPRFHVYTFARATSSDDANDVEEVAVDIVADELLPYITTMAENDDDCDETDDTPKHRRRELNEEFNANVSTRLVRDVAPGKVVVCVGFSLTPKLIRYMQGDYRY